MEVGNGKLIDIWKDPWLGSSPAHPLRVTKLVPQQLRNEFSQIKRVEDLLSDQGRDWNINILQSILPEKVLKEVLAIRPGGDNTTDSYSWNFSTSANYTVKSAYWLEHSIQRGRDLDDRLEANQPNLQPLFTQIWKVDAAPKIKHFLWRCLSNALPVAENLAKRHINKETQCLRCPEVVESVNHTLFQCSFARLVWALSSVPTPQEGAWADSHYTNIHRILNLVQENKEWRDFEKLTPWLLWRLWKNRNELLFKGREWDAQTLVQKAREDAVEWEKRSQELNEEVHHVGHHVRRTERSRIWRRPPVGWLKCNTDGSWFRHGNNSGLGWVLRNNDGNVLWIGVRTIASTKDALDSEAEALRWAMTSLTRMGYSRIIFESDAKKLIDSVKDITFDHLVKPIIYDIRQLLKGFQEATLSFSSREGNKLADRVAKDASSARDHDAVLYSVVPTCYNNLVSQDIVFSYSS